MFQLFKFKPIVGEATKITKTALTSTVVTNAIKQIEPYFWKGRLHTLEEYLKEGDYVLLYDEEITVVPADEFFEYFVFTEDEETDQFRSVRQIKKF